MTGKLLTRLFALFGMTLTCVACYGVGYTEFNSDYGASGRVVDDAGVPIAGIEARSGSDVTETGPDGRFYVRSTSPYLTLSDVDGEENGGEFHEKTITFNNNGSNIDLGDIELERK